MTPSGIDLSRANWYKSSYSGGNGGQCVEVARNLPGVVVVRDSKSKQAGPLIFSRAAWAGFVATLKEPSPRR
ncbi:MAG: hypothetical protein JWL68_6679 [Actinomycetia bacterium]|jgi:hypothetical protein|nr:hypothetical protein [Actinomycetes bacterium]